MPKKNERTILVTGATGHQGGAVLRRLREKGFAVRALTRNPDKPDARALVGKGTEVVRGDLEDASGLRRAMEGVDGVYSVQTPYEGGVEAEVRQGLNLIDAAKRSNVSQFVFSSVGSADKKTGIPHFDSKSQIEERLVNSGLQYTIFRPVFFMENWLGMRDRINQGMLAGPLSPETRLQMIAVDDIGAFVAMAFERPGRWQGRTLDIAGDELSMNDLANAFSRIAGREVRYRQIPWDEFEKQAGREMTTMYQWFENTGYHVDIPAVRQDYTNLMGFERWLHANWTKTLTA